MPVFLIPVVAIIWRWRGPYLIAKLIYQGLDKFAGYKAEGVMAEKYTLLLIEMFINIVVFLFIVLILPFFLVSSTITILLASYYLASIIWGLYHSIPNSICVIKNKFIWDDSLDCIIERETGFWKSLFFGGTIKEAIIPTIIYMIVASVLYVVLFRFLAMPYFVQDATGMGLVDVIMASIYLPVKELIVYIF